MRVGKQTFVDVDGYPGYTLEIDGKEALFVLGTHKLNLLEEGFISLGPGFSEYTVTIPADESKGRPETVLDSFTDDPRVVQMYRDFDSGKTRE